ncbi:hypothetical protein GCM10009749_27810 [Agromyces neolithicus]|uniref:Uncharacterized protein n=1 Tax=Agromyces neolithicus TaxID=269420 RepID=A0ABN2M9S9_9MICO
MNESQTEPTAWHVPPGHSQIRRQNPGRVECETPLTASPPARTHEPDVPPMCIRPGRSASIESAVTACDGESQLGDWRSW